MELSESNIYGELPTTPVVMAACDSNYFIKFAPAFVSSMNHNLENIKGHTTPDVHIHVVNPTEEVLALASYFHFRSSRKITFTFNDVDLSKLGSDQEARAYYASLRFFVAPTLLKYCFELLILDIDCISMGNFRTPDNYDLGYFPREPLEGTVGWEQEGTKVAAGCVYFSKNAMNVCEAVAKTLHGLPLKWFNDQIALNHVFSQVPDELCWKYTSLFMDWEFKDGTVIWTGKGPRKYDNPTYVKMQKQYHDSFMDIPAEYNQVILKPRLDVPFKRLGLCRRGKIVEPIRVHWQNFVDKIADDKTCVVESPRWMFNSNIEKYFPRAEKILVPHVEQHNWKGGDKAEFYMQTVFPWLFTVDKLGWAGGASYIDTFRLNEYYDGKAFKMMQGELGQGKFGHLQKQTTDWSGIDKDNYIIVPLQLPHDETIKWHSDITCEEFVTALCEFADNYVACPQVVFKGHPVNLGAMEPLRQIISKYKNAHYIADANFNELVEQSVGMWVLNGGSGQEAMLAEKPVACFGRCDYAPAVVQGNIKDMGSTWNKFWGLVASKSIEGNPIWTERLELYRRWYHWYINHVTIDTRN